MSTSEIISPPPLPDVIKQSLGLAATQRVEKLEERMTALELSGSIKPATGLNLSPFVLSLGSGLISFEIPACPTDPKKKFSVTTIKTCRSYPIYRGNQEMSDKSIQTKWDVNIVLPIQQLMEFRHYYVGESDEDQATKQGGFVVFEGEAGGISAATVVRAPQFIYRKRNRYIVFNERPLGELIAEQEAMLKRKCMAVLDQASHYWDNEKQRAYIQKPEHIWHDFALRRQWISSALAWRTVHTPEEQRCPRCAQQYASKTGVCKCGSVVEPFVAYFAGEIHMDHVRMSTLNAEQWKKVRAEEKRRQEARGE